jgi:magnesium-protoporphyrin O-methyltransferase
MDCCQCKGIEDFFDERVASSELASYREKGPEKTTRWLIEALEAEGVHGLDLLDIGGGVGAVHHELLEAGVESATDVDASNAYIKAARSEAQRRGLADRVTYRHANFVDAASEIPPADIVTLDRVICCFPDMHNMVSLSAARARRLYGLVYPRDTWLIRFGLGILNLFQRLRRRPFRVFAHATREVEALVTESGLKRRFYRRTLFWQVIVYTR